MTTFGPVRTRFRAEIVPFAIAALLAAVPAGAQQRSPGHGGGGGDGGRSAHSTSGAAPSMPAPKPSYGSGGSSGSGSTGSSGGRTAHEVPGTPGPDRQPTYRRGGGGHGGGHGPYYGGYYDPYYWNYPYGSWSRWGWGWGVWWGPDYDPYYYPSYRDRGYYDRDRMGALDFDVSPGRAEIYIDGRYVGTADDYDGWPRYLWLPRGTYDVVVYLDGYQTISRQISVYPGTVLDLDDSMQRGTSVRPDDLASKSHERRDERLRDDRERSREVDQQAQDEDWRDRMHRDRGRYDRRRIDSDDDGDRGSAERRGGDSVGNGHLVLDVDPDDASVYVDGRFVGTGSDLSQMRSGLPLAPGEHKLAVVRPGRKAEERDFTVKAGEDVKVDVELDEGD